MPYFQPVSRTIKKASGTQEASKSKYASAAIKSISSTASSSKIVEPSTSLCEGINNVSIQENDASEPTSNPSTSTDFTVRKKVGRRRSYTSLLVAGAKVWLTFIVYHLILPLELILLLSSQLILIPITILQLLDKCVTEIANNLPSIDNECNQMEVAEYVEEIYHYYWVTEVMFVILSKRIGWF